MVTVVPGSTPKRSAFHGNSQPVALIVHVLLPAHPRAPGISQLDSGFEVQSLSSDKVQSASSSGSMTYHPIITSLSSRTCSFLKALIPAESRLNPNSHCLSLVPRPHSLLNAPSLASILSHSAPSRRSPPSCARFQYLTVGPHGTSPKQNQQQQHQQQPQLEVPRQDSCRFHGWTELRCLCAHAM